MGKRKRTKRSTTKLAARRVQLPTAAPEVKQKKPRSKSPGLRPIPWGHLIAAFEGAPSKGSSSSKRGATPKQKKKRRNQATRFSAISKGGRSAPLVPPDAFLTPGSSEAPSADDKSISEVQRPSLLPLPTLVFEIACFAAATSAWLFSLAHIDQSKLTELGLVAIVPWTFWLALIATVLGFTASLNLPKKFQWLALVQLFAVIALVHGTPALTYESLRYPWAWKHLGIIDYIYRHHAIDPADPSLAAYHNWPALFISAAWIMERLHLDLLHLANLANYAPPILELCYVAALAFVYRRFSDDWRLVCAACFIFLAGNWIGQDYFSPQGFCFLLYLIVIALCLGPLRKGPQREALQSQSQSAGFLTLLRREDETPMVHIGAASRAALVVLASFLIVVVAASHQLTPIAMILGLGALWVTGRISFMFVLIAAFAETVWLLTFASPFLAVELAKQLKTMGGGMDAAVQSMVAFDVLNRDQAIVVFSGRALSATIALLALFGGLRRLAFGKRDATAAFLALTPIALLLFRYEGEIHFRVYLFALPFLSFFAASLFFPTVEEGRSLLTKGLFCGIGVILLVGFLLANDGKDQRYAFDADEVATTDKLYRAAPAGSLLVVGNRNFPLQFRNYENFTLLSISEENDTAQQRILQDPAKNLAEWLSDTKWKGAYVVITASQKYFNNSEHVMKPNALQAIEDSLLKSPEFVVYEASAHAIVFTLKSRTENNLPQP
jgi:hypothetical protein